MSLKPIEGMISQLGFTVGDRAERTSDSAIHPKVHRGAQGWVIGFSGSPMAPGGYLVLVVFDGDNEPYGNYFDKLKKVASPQPVAAIPAGQSISDKPMPPVPIPGWTVASGAGFTGGTVTVTLNGQVFPDVPVHFEVSKEATAGPDPERLPDGTCTSCYGYPECSLNCEANLRRRKKVPDAQPF